MKTNASDTHRQNPESGTQTTVQLELNRRTWKLDQPEQAAFLRISGIATPYS